MTVTFCMVKLVYPNIPSSIAPEPHDEHIPIQVPTTTDQVNMELSDKDVD